MNWKRNEEPHHEGKVLNFYHAAFDFLIDMHTSTSNCGVMITLVKNDQ